MNNMDDVEKAAVLLLGMGEDQASEVLKHLSPKQIQRVGNVMSHLNSLTKKEIHGVIKDFLSITASQTSLGVESEEYIRQVFTEALGEDKAGGLLDDLFEKEEEGLNALRWLDSKTIADMFRNEHPQIVSTILTYLDSEQTAGVLSCYPQEKVVDLLLRMSANITVKPEALSELGKVIEQQLYLGNKTSKGTAMGGIKNVADIVNYFESTLEEQVLEGFKSQDKELAQQVRELMFVFEDLPGLDGRSIQAILKEVSSETLITALKGASENVQNVIFSNMSKRAAELLADDLEAKGPLRISIVEAAQKEILATAQRLADAGDIVLGKGGEEMV